ncbi:MED7-domain-containing protein [Xylariaceae sp. FL0594]|nr:MED7-domain-containing protein [Xylariaceae sp. FL0594]
MEEEQQQASATWPPPPPFWKSFTLDNVARIEDLRKETAERLNIQDPWTIRLEGLPRGLRNLQPPAEPTNGEWRVFGARYMLREELPRLEDGEIRRLFPQPEDRDQDGKHFDRATILKRLAKSLLLNFLELNGLLATQPDAAQDKITDIRDLFINFHHLINEYRPHQARESLIALMQSQLDRRRAETNAIRDAVDKAERVLEGLSSLTIEEQPINSISKEVKPRGRDIEAWALLVDS